MCLLVFLPAHHSLLLAFIKTMVAAVLIWHFSFWTDYKTLQLVFIFIFSKLNQVERKNIFLELFSRLYYTLADFLRFVHNEKIQMLWHYRISFDSFGCVLNASKFIRCFSVVKLLFPVFWTYFIIVQVQQHLHAFFTLADMLVWFV